MSRLACLAIALCLPLVVQAQSGARLTFSEGQARLLRGDQVFTTPRGLPLANDDMLETGEAASSIIETGDGTLFSTGPGSRLMLGSSAGKIDRPLLRSGWLKMQSNDKGEARSFSTPHATISGKAVSLILRSTDSGTELFVETGDATLTPARGGKTMQVKAGQFLAQRGDKPASIQPRPEAAFLDAVPRSFRDRLPSLAARYAETKTTPRLLGEARYEDIADWLAGPLAWRGGFIKRYESRLSDKTFRTALEANLARHPEWSRALYPEKHIPRRPTADQEPPKP